MTQNQNPHSALFIFPNPFTCWTAFRGWLGTSEPRTVNFTSIPLAPIRSSQALTFIDDLKRGQNPAEKLFCVIRQVEGPATDPITCTLPDLVRIKILSGTPEEIVARLKTDGEFKDSVIRNQPVAMVEEEAPVAA